jgi:hypothetical protein
LAVLHEERFVDLPPAQVWAQLLDAGQVPPCSIRTMYRVLAANQEVRERRNQLQPWPERFPRGAPVPPPLPTAAWINKPRRRRSGGGRFRTEIRFTAT